MPIRFKLTLVLIFLFAAKSAVFSGEAVSGLNGKLGYNYGDFDSDSGQSLSGTVSFPLNAHFGTQVDGIYARIAGNDFYGIGGHLFWRDWDRGLIGLAFGGVESKSVRTGEVGVEAEYYTKYVTFGAYGGVSTIKYETPVPFIDTNVTKPFGTVYLGFYPLPDLLIRPSYTRKLDINQYQLEAEYAFPRQNISITASGMIADHDFHQYQIGIRYYFGGHKSLKSRHRQDDPVDVVSGSLSAIGTYGAKYIENANAYIRSLQAAGPIASGSTLGGSLVFQASGSMNSYQGATSSITKVGDASGTLILPPGGMLFSSDGGLLGPGTFTLLDGGQFIFDGSTLNYFLP